MPQSADTTKKILTYVAWFFAIYLGLSFISSIFVCVGKTKYNCQNAARDLGERYGGLMLLASAALTWYGVKKKVFPRVKFPLPTSERVIPETHTPEGSVAAHHAESARLPDLSGLKDKINYKAVLLGIGGGFIGGIVGGILIGIYLQVIGQSSSVEMLGFYLQEHLILLYALNIFGGLVLGFIVSRIARKHLSENLLIASSSFILLSVITNNNLWQGINMGIYSFGELANLVFLPLLAAWLSPFIFLFKSI